MPSKSRTDILNSHKVKPIYIFIIVVFGLCGCQQEETLESGIKNEYAEDFNYLKFSFAQASTVSSEDKVHDLTILIFNSETQELEYRRHISDIEQSIELPEIKPGNYDFYYMANTAHISVDWGNIQNTNDLKTLSINSHGRNASYVEQYGVLMTDIMKNVRVELGGTEANPLLVHELTNGEVVKLVRSVSKIDIKLLGDGLIEKRALLTSNLTLVELRNIPERILPFGQLAVGTSLKTLKVKLSDFVDQQNSLDQHLYIPGTLTPSKTSWNNNSDIIPTLFLKMIDGQEFEIPLASNYSKKWKLRYLDFAKGKIKSPTGEEAKYNLKQNTHYIYQVRLNKNNLEIGVEILPWEVEEINNNDYTEPTYLGPEIWLNTDDLTNGNTLEIRKYETTPEIRFWLKSPKSARWKATLSNGLNFKFAQDSQGIADLSEITGTKSVSVTTRMLPTMGQSPTSELYFTVNGKEVPLTVRFRNGNSKSFYGSDRLTLKIIH